MNGETWFYGWDAVDEGSAESFPASDPPAWMGSVARAVPSAASLAETEKPTRRVRLSLIVTVLIVAAGAVLLFRHRRTR